MIENKSNNVVQKVWSFCNILRDDGVSYGDYLEQLTYLLFLKMADEFTKPPYKRILPIPEEYSWQSLVTKNGAELEEHYVATLKALSNQSGMLGQIFVKSQNKIQNPAMLSKLIDMIDKQNWVSLGTDVKGEIYEGLLEKNAEDTKSGAGQYFTPRALIKAMVECIEPQPNKTIIDPACGTGGFILAAYDYIEKINKLDKDQREFLRNKTFYGNEIVANTRRLCLMNLFLHNIGDIDGDTSISINDALLSEPSQRFDYVLTNPPFGKKSSLTITNENGEEKKQDQSYNRQDFWKTTSNKQLNFVQHIYTLLKENGKAAVVVPDNVLFEGGAGETIRKELMKLCNLHTILRLPTGIFYAQGVKANILFFERKPAQKEAWTKEVWFYDLRTNVNFTLKENPLKFADLEDFIKCYNSKNIHKRTELYSKTNPEGRWRKYTYAEILERDKTNLDIFWLKDDSMLDLENLPEPDEFAAEIIENIEEGLAKFKEVLKNIEQ